jgi:hypothetical protein
LPGDQSAPIVCHLGDGRLLELDADDVHELVQEAHHDGAEGDPLGVPLAVDGDQFVALGRGQFAGDGRQRSSHRHSGQLLHQRYHGLLRLVDTLIGVVPNCDRYLEIWPPAFRTYNILVPNLLNLPVPVFGVGGPPAGVVGLAMYVSSRTAGCAYCSAHTCSFALRRGAAPDKVAAALLPDQSSFTRGDTVGPAGSVEPSGKDCGGNFPILRPTIGRGSSTSTRSAEGSDGPRNRHQIAIQTMADRRSWRASANQWSLVLGRGSLVGRCRVASRPPLRAAGARRLSPENMTLRIATR